MNREIKFRGFNRKNSQWLYGFYLQNRGAHFVCPDEFATGKSWEDYEIDRDTLGQYTGLHDKKGNEIYEGDVFNIKYFKIKVTYDQDNCSFCLRKKDGDEQDWRFPLDRHSEKRFVIIGNIYDHHELLKP